MEIKQETRGTRGQSSLKKICKYCDKGFDKNLGKKWVYIRGNNGIVYVSHENKECFEGVWNGKTKNEK